MKSTSLLRVNVSVWACSIINLGPRNNCKIGLEPRGALSEGRSRGHPVMLQSALRKHILDGCARYDSIRTGYLDIIWAV